MNVSASHIPFVFRRARYRFESTFRYSLPYIAFASALFGLSLKTQAGQLTLSWIDHSDNEDGFKIERSSDSVNFQEIAIVGENETTYIDDSVVDDQSYSYRVKAYNGFGESDYSNVAVGMFESPNTPPSLSPPANQTVLEGSSLSNLPFTIGDAETSSADLSVNATSSNTGLLPASGISLSGSGSNRFLSLTPLPGLNGSTYITISVSDGKDTTSASFSLFVQTVSAPSISPIANQTIARGNAFTPIAFTIGDQETSPSDLSIAVSSSNESLIPLSNIIVSGNGAERTATISTAPDAIGTSTIEITVGDGSDETTLAFELVVTSPPLITSPLRDVEVLLGATALLAIDSEAYPTPTYQWFFNGLPIAGATGPNLTIAEAAPEDEGRYKVSIANELGSVTSGEAQLSVDTSAALPSAPTELDVEAR